MTDEPDRSNVVAFRPKPRPQPFTLPEAMHFGVRAYRNEAPGVALPIAAVLECQGHRVGCLGCFTDDEQGHAAAGDAARIALATIELLSLYQPPTGDRSA